MGLETVTEKMQHMAEVMDNNFRNYLFAIDIKLVGLTVDLTDERM